MSRTILKLGASSSNPSSSGTVPYTSVGQPLLLVVGKGASSIDEETLSQVFPDSVCDDALHDVEFAPHGGTSVHGKHSSSHSSSISSHHHPPTPLDIRHGVTNNMDHMLVDGVGTFSALMHVEYLRTASVTHR